MNNSVELWHFNPATGRSGKCRAGIRECPFGNSEAHGSSPDEARLIYESTQQSLPRPTKKAKVYRIGELKPRESHFEHLQGLLRDFAKTTPPGRLGRHEGLFASPDLQSHGRWVLGVGRGESHELTVNPHEVYIYPVELYEEASMAQMDRDYEEFERLAQEYWESGMTLSEWQAWAIHAKPEPGTWELLIPTNAATESKPVSNRRIIENSSKRNHNRLNWELERDRASQGKIYERKPSPWESADSSQ